MVATAGGFVVEKQLARLVGWSSSSSFGSFTKRQHNPSLSLRRREKWAAACYRCESAASVGNPRRREKFRRAATRAKFRYTLAGSRAESRHACDRVARWQSPSMEAVDHEGKLAAGRDPTSMRCLANHQRGGAFPSKISISSAAAVAQRDFALREQRSTS